MNKCEKCETPLEIPPDSPLLKFNMIPRYCEPCSEILTLESEKNAESASIATARRSFYGEVAPIYRETDLKRLPERLRAVCDSWEFNPKGLGFISETGLGKTRACVYILDRMISEKRTVFFISSTDLASACASQFSDDPSERHASALILRRCQNVGVLCIDDIGKNRFTERAQVEFYDILEKRTSWKRPTLWSANSSAENLFKMFSGDKADAILRRLVDFSTMVSL